MRCNKIIANLVTEGMPPNSSRLPTSDALWTMRLANLTAKNFLIASCQLSLAQFVLSAVPIPNELIWFTFQLIPYINEVILAPSMGDITNFVFFHVLNLKGPQQLASSFWGSLVKLLFYGIFGTQFKSLFLFVSSWRLLFFPVLCGSN